TEATSFTSITGSGSLTVNSALNGDIDLSAYTGNVTIDNANGKNVTLGDGNDTITTTTGGMVSTGNGDDHLTLDFTNLTNLTFDGGIGTDTLALTSVGNISATAFDKISNIESLDTSSFSSGSMTIDFTALDHIATTANAIDLKLTSSATTSINNLTEVYLASDVTHTNLVSSGSWSASSGTNNETYVVSNVANTFDLHLHVV
ncbi:MAG: hypothetical protein J0647_01090, partial [Campylobacteraceae bacterium]|nr:hypothetical protein [Campylobacteraceae bacterium]